MGKTVQNVGTRTSEVFYTLLISSEVAQQYGLWETVVTDAGTEFNLTLFMQHYLRDRATGGVCKRPPYKQIKSTKVFFLCSSSTVFLY